jgi:hypothetical protein
MTPPLDVVIGPEILEKFRADFAAEKLPRDANVQIEMAMGNWSKEGVLGYRDIVDYSLETRGNRYTFYFRCVFRERQVCHKDLWAVDISEDKELFFLLKLDQRYDHVATPGAEVLGCGHFFLAKIPGDHSPGLMGIEADFLWSPALKSLAQEQLA